MNKELDELNKTFKRAFDTVDGVKVLEYLVSKYYDKRAYSKGDPYHTAYLQGKRDVISEIRKKVLEKLDGN